MILQYTSSYPACFVCITGRVTELVRVFNNEWKKSIEMINAEVMQSFTNFKNGTQILQVTLIIIEGNF